MRGDGELPSCSFCGTGRQQVGKLIAGSQAHICDGCVDLMHAVLAEPGRTASTPVATIQQVSVEAWSRQCGFCGQLRYRAEAMASAGDPRIICSDCLDLCDEIIREEPPVPRR